jgi:hypothetical protein
LMRSHHEIRRYKILEPESMVNSFGCGAFGSLGYKTALNLFLP